MEMTFTFPGGARVDGQIGPHVVKTDQPPDATAPSPFTLFLASIGACAGVYVQAFCRRRGIPMDGIRIVQRNITRPDGMVERVELDVELPPEFPERYREAVVRAADHCTVKQHLELPPLIAVRAAIAKLEPAGAV
jgi:ribosomal protein S12 methylthiotransferase accessory factor